MHHNDPSTSTQGICDSRKNGALSDAEALESLRSILFSREQADLAALREKLDELKLSTEDLGRLLPGAVRVATRENDELSDALGPMFGSAIKSAIKTDADSIADAISPIMGPAIRVTIQQSIRGMVQSLNKTLEYSVSVKGLKWRWEAFKTGKSFAEVVLLHTLRFRVVQVFLIDRETGLLISHAALDETAENVDLASGMLTAIQDFVRDSFGGSKDDSLTNMSFGGQTVWIETGVHAFLALVIEGEAPASLRTTVQEALERIHLRFGQELEAYQGDSTPLAGVNPILTECLVSVYEEDEKKKKKPKERKTQFQHPLWRKATLTVGILGILIGIFVLDQRLDYHKQIRDLRHQLAAPDTIQLSIEHDALIARGQAHQQWIEQTANLAPRLPGIEGVQLQEVTNLDQPWKDYLEEIKNTPGLIVTQATARNGQYALFGLRDPLAINPTELLQSFDIPIECVTATWRPFQSLERSIVEKRLLTALPSNPTVRTERVGGSLRFTGRATAEWVRATENRLGPIAGDTIRLDFTRVKTDSQ